MTEARLDQEAPGDTRDFLLPGLRVTLPKVQLYSLVLRRDAEGKRWLAGNDAG
ncbi:MAG: hypothetical protein U0Y68_24870 [Blastocatellia bacterium]